jgi:hypothetical protein
VAARVCARARLSLQAFCAALVKLLLNAVVVLLFRLVACMMRERTQR